MKKFDIALLVAALLSAMLCSPASALAQEPAKKLSKPVFNQSQRTNIEAIIRDYLLKHPELIEEAMQARKDQEQALPAEKARQAIGANRDALLNDPNTPVGGNPNGNVTIVEFFDYRCGYCKQVRPVVAALIAADPDVRVVYKEFPILGPQSVYGARAALAARNQNKYMETHEALMTSETVDENALVSIAARLGLDAARLLVDMEHAAVNKIIDENHKLATMLSISGTPAFVVGDRMIPGATNLDGMMELVSEERKRLKLQAK